MKNFLGLLALALVVACGECNGQDAGEAGKQLVANGGRFVFGQINGMRVSTYMLDTQSGRLWVLTEDPKTKQQCLQVVNYVTMDGRIAIPEPLSAEKEFELISKAKASPAP